MTQELELQFTGVGEVKNYTFTQIKKGNRAFIYKSECSGAVNYEVFERKEVKVCLDFEKRLYSDTELKVKYPKSNDFGTWAFATRSLERAMSLFEEIENKPVLINEIQNKETAL